MLNITFIEQSHQNSSMSSSFVKSGIHMEGNSVTGNAEVGDFFIWIHAVLIINAVNCFCVVVNARILVVAYGLIWSLGGRS